MLNFGLTEMRLVAPRDGWPNPSAGPAAAGADRILETAQVFDSVADAVAAAGGRASALALDVTDDSALVAAIRSTAARHGRLWL